MKNLNFVINIDDTTMNNSNQEEFVNIFSMLIDSLIEEPSYKPNLIDKNSRVKIRYELFELAVIGFCTMCVQGIYLFYTNSKF